MSREVHVCPILMRTVIFENQKCTERCDEQDCPVAELLKQEES